MNISKRNSTLKTSMIFVIATLQKNLLDYRKHISNEINQKQPFIKQAYSRISQLIINHLPEFILHIYGSDATNLSTPWSLLDLVLVYNNSNNNNNLNHSYLFQRLREMFLTQNWVYHIEFTEIIQ